MKAILESSELLDILEKVEQGERLSREDGLALYRSKDLLLIGHMANIVRQRRNGDKAFYVVNRHINYTNVCKNRCKFCAFSRDEGENGAYAMDIGQILQEAEGVVRQGATEIHIVGGLHPKLGLGYYLEMLSRLHELFPEVHLQAFTAVEIAHISERGGFFFF